MVDSLRAAPRPSATTSKLEFERNGERYAFLRWGQDAFDNFRVVPPGTGICHQVNLEYLAQVVWTTRGGRQDHRLSRHAGRHRQPHHDGQRPRRARLGRRRHRGRGGDARPADLDGAARGRRLQALRHAQGRRDRDRSRAHRDADAAQEGRGRPLRRVLRPGHRRAWRSPTARPSATWRRNTARPAASSRSTGDDPLSRPSPAATRSASKLVEAYAKAQGLWHDEQIARSRLHRHAGARSRRPSSRRSPGRAGRRTASPLSGVAQVLRGRAAEARRHDAMPAKLDRAVPVAGTNYDVKDGDVVIAAITSCTNTSNPSVMLAAGLLARNAVQARPQGQALGQDLARAGQPGRHRLLRRRRPAGRSRRAGLQPRRLWLHHLHRQFRAAARADRRGRRRRAISWSRRCSPAIAISRAASTRRCAPTIWPRRRSSSPTPSPASMNVDLTKDPLGDGCGRQAGLSPRHLAVEPGGRTTRSAKSSDAGDVPQALRQRLRRPGGVAQGRRSATGKTFSWDMPARPMSPHPPYFDNMPKEPAPLQRRASWRGRWRILGDSITTDHISPAGSIKKDSPAGAIPAWSIQVRPADFNSYGARRGNHEVMMRGTFANIRITQRDGARRRRRHDQASARRQGDADLRRGDALSEGRRAAGHRRRQGIRHRLVARLGGQGHAAARRHAPSSSRASSASTARTSSAWACCRCSSRTAPTARPSKLDGSERFDILGIAAGLKPRIELRLPHPPRQRHGRDGAAALPHRHARRARIFPPRRHPAIRAAQHDEGGLAGRPHRRTVQGGSAGARACLVLSAAL